MTVRELESVLPKTCDIKCYSNKTGDLIFISHGSIHTCEGSRSHEEDNVARIIESKTALLGGNVSVWVNEVKQTKQKGE